MKTPRKRKPICPCRHCGANGWDAYMLQGDLWKMVLPPDVPAGYSAGFVYLRCALESIDRPLYREDISGCLSDQFPLLDEGIEIRFPKRDWKRKTHVIYFLPWGPSFDDPVTEIIDKYGWLLDRLAMQASRLVIRESGMEEDGSLTAFTVGTIAL
jgi:hypothetical protein